MNPRGALGRARDSNNSAPSLRDARVLLPFLVITLIWSTTWIVIKGQLGPVPPIWSVSYRFLISGAVMFALAKAGGARIGLDRTGHRLALLLGLLQFVGNYNFVYAAEQYVPSGLVAMVFAMLILPNALLARLCFGIGMSGRFLAGSAVALAGMGLLFAQEIGKAGGAADGVAAGLALTFGGVLAASCANVMQLAPAVKARSIAAMLGWAMLYGGLIDGALAWALNGPPVGDPRPLYWLELFYLSVVASAVAFFLYYRIIRQVGPAEAAYSSVLIPILAMAISTFAEAYRWTPLAAAGALVALAGLVIALGARRIAPPPPAD